MSGALGDPGFSHYKPFADIAPFVGNLSLSSLPSLLTYFLFLSFLPLLARSSPPRDRTWVPCCGSVES